jgi:pyruvate dehydrogenase E2 component (dihydrolipoyllysine-residue acetyltransferase)
MAEFVMPKLGADMSAGTLTCWHKKVGDVVHRGDIIAEVETEKGNIDVEVFADGAIEKFLVAPGEKVPVGTALALIREDGRPSESAPSPAAPAAAKSAQVVAPPPPGPKIVPGRRTAPHVTERLAISPSARRLARELGVDPATVHGTGHGGAITRDDIERAAASTTTARAAAAPEAAGPAADRSARIRQTIAAAMSRSKREIPHYYLNTTIDMHRALAWLSEQNASRPVAERILYGAVVLKAVALALHEVPELNATWQDGKVVLKKQIHVGVAIALRQGGLVAPALHDTDQLTLAELMQQMRDLVNRTRAGSLRSSEMSDPTITVTSLGEQGVETVYGVIYPPQVAMVGVGKIVERPWCVEGQVVPRRVVTITLSADHRVSDGHRGAIFLAAADRLLQEPEKL